jgi:hypothetical protein
MLQSKYILHTLKFVSNTLRFNKFFFTAIAEKLKYFSKLIVGKEYTHIQCIRKASGDIPTSRWFQRIPYVEDGNSRS